jgi:hypothetical protein
LGTTEKQHNVAMCYAIASVGEVTSSQLLCHTFFLIVLYQAR